MFDTQPGMTTPSSPGAGHNSGDLRAIDPESLRAELLNSSAAIVLRCDSLRNASLRMPTAIAEDDEEKAKNFGDFIKQLGDQIKVVEAERVKQKAPFILAGNTVDGFFNGYKDPLTTAKRTAETILATFLRAKEDKARRLEAERKRLEAAELQRQQDELAAKQKQQDDAALLARQQAETARQQAQELAPEDSKKAAALLRTADNLDAKADKATERADNLENDIKRAGTRSEAAAIAAANVETAKPGRFARTRGDYGSKATLREFWDFADLDRSALDLEALRQHLPADALEKAVRSFIRAQGRELRGVRIFKTDRPVVS